MTYAWYCSEDHGDDKISFYHGGWRKNRKSFHNAFSQAEKALKNKIKKRNDQGNLGYIPIDEIYWVISGPLLPSSDQEIMVEEIEKIVEEKGSCLLRPSVQGIDHIQGWIRIDTMGHLKEEQEWLVNSMIEDAQKYADQDNESVTITNLGSLGSVTAYPNDPEKLKFRK